MTIGFDEAGPDHAGITFGPITTFPSEGPDGPDLRTIIPVSAAALDGAAVEAAIGGVNASAFGGLAAGTVAVVAYGVHAGRHELTLVWRSRPWNAWPWPGLPPHPEVDLARLLGLEPPAPAPNPEDRPMAEAATMQDLWDQCEAQGEDHALLAVDFYRSIRDVLRVTGPVYRRGLDSEGRPIISWLGIDPWTGNVTRTVSSGGPERDASLVPPGMVGGPARDAATVPVPVPEAESWRKRPPLFW
jgi:hypothetical protein